MQRNLFLLVVAAALCLGPAVRAQDPAMEERLNKMSAEIEDLRAVKDLQEKRIAELTKAVEDLRVAQSQPNASYATQEDLRKLGEQVRDELVKVDKKREDDNAQIANTIEKLGKAVGASARPAKRETPDAPPPSTSTQKIGGDTGIKYKVKKGDSLIAIVQACKQKNIKTSVDAILQQNPGLKPGNLIPDKEIWVPVIP